MYVYAPCVSSWSFFSEASFGTELAVRASRLRRFRRTPVIDLPETHAEISNKNLQFPFLKFARRLVIVISRTTQTTIIAAADKVTTYLISLNFVTDSTWHTYQKNSQTKKRIDIINLHLASVVPFRMRFATIGILLLVSSPKGRFKDRAKCLT